MNAPKEILDLVARFEQQLDACKSGQYNETQLRQEFLNPFFKALGWDVDNTAGFAQAYKDVIHEDAIRISGAVKAPDYCFRIGGTRKFFLEAKKPSVDIRQEVSPAHQLRSYTWSAKLPLSILSDFEEFAVYDGRIPPRKDDPASTARIFYCTFHEYAEKWDWIASIFSKEAIQKGSFDKFAESIKAKRGTAEVDAHFLGTIEAWRNELARNIALRNPKLTQRELNFAVQRIIDRIIFLRICEDRGIEDYGRLRGLVNGDRIYPRLCQLFEAADARYNSGLFHFKPEPNRHEDPDELTLALDLDDKPLRDILRNLYFPDSPYQFSVISADILGQVYEQFLGKVIRLTEGHRAVVDDKPEVKKAGGVYYTPTYIVDYIVRQTVGKLVEDQTPKQAEKLRILDPACGSGSFLIGAYQFLLDWHLQFYTANDPGKWAKGGKPALVQTGNGWKLTIAERKRILLNNIYGVDIDTQAVEVTKLSLLLKVLEGETGQTLQTIFRLFQERALPDLGDNIKCGNSLIGPDFYQQQQMSLLDDEERYRINVFDWHAEFPQVFRRKSSTGELRDTASPLDYTMPGVPLHGSYSYKKLKGEKTAPTPAPPEPEWEGGFDAVIGNPPYLAGREWTEELWRQRPYFGGHYSCMTDQYDLYALFIQRAVELLRESGRFGFITPTTWLNNEHYITLRRWITQKAEVRLLGDYRDVRVFPTATVLPVVIVATRKDRPSSKSPCCIEQFTEPKKYHSFESGVAVWDQFPDLIFNLSISKQDLPILKRIEEQSQPCEAFADVRFGVKVYQRGKGKPKQSGKEAEERSFEAEKKQGNDYHPYLWGEHVTRWRIQAGNAWLKYGSHLAEPRTFDLFTGPRILLRRIVGERLILCPTTDVLIADQLLHTVKPRTQFPDYRFLAAVLASKAIAYYFRKRFNRTEKTFPEIRIAELAALPIRVINPANPADKSRHDQIVQLVEQMLTLHQRLSVAKTPQEKTALARQITATDTQLDRLVYDLYGLTPEEIKMVEGAAS